MSTTEFRITVKMGTRWVPHFLGMLKRMQVLGSMGSSRQVAIYADGDGDFHPTFKWDSDLPEPARPIKDSQSGDVLFDAG